ncbi:MAG: UbiX family flavin prenyltransferase [Epsilonproteobacteria bacterium]|nr:UbiX family flavin prenyltransferase [Campylobacterota bacterium]
MRIVVAISGASALKLGIKTFSLLPSSVEKYLILSKGAKKVLKKENPFFSKKELKRLSKERVLFKNSEIEAPVASGSFQVDVMMVVPCSMNTLAKIANGIGDNLITRSAQVVIKERKRLLLAPRELPFSALALENMNKLAKLNVIIAPPVVGYYSYPKDLEEMENFIIGKWFDLIGIEHNLYKRWG